MEKKHIISLGGELASRKRYSIKNINAKTKYSVYRNGDYFRKLAKENEWM